jgi:hypothetical protein
MKLLVGRLWLSLMVLYVAVVCPCGQVTVFACKSIVKLALATSASAGAAIGETRSISRAWQPARLSPAP